MSSEIAAGAGIICRGLIKESTHEEENNSHFIALRHGNGFRICRQGQHLSSGISVLSAYGGYGAAGIGHGFQGDDGSLDLDLGADLLVSDNGTDWDDFDGSTRKKYMKSK